MSRIAAAGPAARRDAVVHLDAVVGGVDEQLALRADEALEKGRGFAATADLDAH